MNSDDDVRQKTGSTHGMNDEATVLAGPFDTLDEAEEAFREYDMSPSRDYYIVKEDREVLQG